MVYLANLSGTTYLTESTPIYQGSSIVNTITIVCPLPKTSNATVTFKLPNGMPTQPKLMTRQGESFIGENIIGVLNAWSVELDQYVTNYAGTVEVQFDFYRGYGNENNSAILSSFKTAFEVQPGIVPSLPPTPTQTIYEEILSALTNVENQQFGKFELFGENVYNVVEWVDAIDGVTGDTYLVNRINPEHYVNIGNAIFTNGSFNSSTPITLTPNTTNWTFEIDGYTKSGYNLLTIGELITVIANGNNYAIVVGENTYGAVAESNANLFAFAKTENTLSVYYNGVLLDEIDINIGNPLITIGNNISYDFSTYKLFDIAIDEDFAYEEWRGQIYRDDKLDANEKYKMDLLFNYGQDITTLYKDTVHTISAEWQPPSNGINNHELDLKLKNAEGDVISTVTIDFPLESLVVDATYDSENRAIVLILDNKDEITIPIGDIFKGLITEENIGEQSVKYAVSAGSATKDATGNVINTYYATKSSVDVLSGTVSGFETSIEEAIRNSEEAISKAEEVENSVNSALNGKADQGEVDTLSQEQAAISPLARDSAQGITLSASKYKYTFTLKNYLGNNAGENTSAVTPSVELDLGDMIQSGEFGVTSTYPGGAIALKPKNPLLNDIIIPLTNNITSQNIGEQRVAYATNSMYYVDVDDANNPKYIAGTISALNTAVQEATSTVGTFQSQINGKADAEAVANQFLAVEQANSQLSGEIDVLKPKVLQHGTDISTLQASVDTLNGNSFTTGSVQYYVAREETRATSVENALRTDVNTAFDDISVEYNTTTHEITITMGRVSGESKSQSFNLPLESAIVNASYNNATKAITFTLQSGDTLTVQLADIISGLATTSDLNDVDSRLTTAISEVSTALNQKASINYVDSGLSAKADTSSLSSVATTGNYNDLSNKPSINNATLTIQKNGVTVSTFSANAAENSVANILVPTSTSGLTNDSGFVDSVYVNNAITDALDDYTAPVDSALSTTSINPVQNKVITEALNNKISSSGQLSENKVLVTNSFGEVISSSVSSSALNNIQGLTSGAQAQIDLIKSDVTTINTNINNNISPAIQEITGNVTTLTSRVDTATQDIDALEETKADVYTVVNGLNTKANQTALDETNQTVSDLVTRVDSISDTQTNIQATLTTKANIGSKSSVSGTNYTIDVPTTSTPYASISKIGGMSKKCTNILPMGIGYGWQCDYSVAADGKITLTRNASGGVAFGQSSVVTLTAGKTYTIDYTHGAGVAYATLNTANTGGAIATFDKPYTFTPSKTVGYYIRPYMHSISVGATASFYLWINEGDVNLPYEPYYSGLRDAKVTEVKSVGVSNTYTLSIPEAVQNLDGYGQSNPDNANEYNYLDLINQKFVTVGHIVNGVWEANNSTEDIDIPDIIGVEGGGTLTFENEYGYGVPYSLEYYSGNNDIIPAKEFVGNLVGVADRAKTADAASNATNAVYASPSTDENSIHIQLQSATGKADTAINTAQSAIQYAGRGVQSISTTYNSGAGSVGTFYLNVNFSGGGSASYDITEDLKELITDVFMFDIN